jgi:NADH-quinone oxidoreductase subunit M|tara:strand:- start:5963 stop:7441 length:1479 start_codon:yes stop_codon:yes gene_type:complete
VEIPGILSIAIFLPFISAVIVAVFLTGKAARGFAVIASALELVVTGYIFVAHRQNGYDFSEKITSWFPESFPVQYFLSVDGISAPLILLTGLLGIVAIFASWNITERTKEHFMWLLLLQGAVIGVFTSMDFLLFFLFWELELIPMFFLISIWGTGRKEYSAMKFLIFTILGSAFMLIGILVIFAGTGTFDMTKISEALPSSNLIMPVGILFLFMSIGFAVKLPVFPLHTWLPDAHTDAPTAASVMLAGVLLKMGGYGLLRVSAGMFPDQLEKYAWVLALLGVINIIYGAAITIRQTDLKRLIAYSSVSHMGFVLLGLSAMGGGITSLAMTGAALQMFTHGTITGLLFLTIGFIYERTHTRHIPDLGGLARRMPVFTVSLVVAGLASLGLPGTSGFVSEVTIFLGAFPAFKLATIIAAFGVVLTAAYILWMIQRSMFGPERERFAQIGDATVVQVIPIGLLIVSIIGVGIYPAFVSNVFTEGIEVMLNMPGAN